MEEESADPEIVSHVDAFVWSDLEFPLNTFLLGLSFVKKSFNFALNCTFARLYTCEDSLLRKIVMYEVEHIG